MKQQNAGDNSPPNYSDVCVCPRPQEQISFVKGQPPVKTGRCTYAKRYIKNTKTASEDTDRAMDQRNAYMVA